jgi:CelD/BcsL family acetyltransferase involved in cellulose biosynthesis
MRQGKQDEVLLEPVGSQREWEDLCAGFAHATAFHRFDFLTAVAPALACRFVPLLATFRGQKVGVAPLLVKQRGPLSFINWVPFPYLGPLVPDALVPATLSALALEARHRRALNHYQWFSHVVPDSAVHGFKAFTDRTLVIPLAGRSDLDLMAAMHRTRQKQIRRAQRSGLKIFPATIEDVQLMDVWNGQFYTARGMPAAYPAGTYERIFSALNDAPGSIFNAARIGSRTIAVEIDLATPDRFFAWQFGVDPSHKHSSPQALLTWNTMLRARDAGASEFDLAGTPTDGIARYKKEFGARERYGTVMRRMARPYQMALPIISRLRGRLS